VGSPASVILFDGDCGFCKRSVQFVLKRDPDRRYMFAPLQSDTASRLLGDPDNRPRGGTGGDTIVLVEDGRCFERSTAVLRIARRLTGAWPALYVFVLVPRAWRDALYDAFARRRFRWFGDASTCPTPGPADRARFLK
jgi:predicted DCC family thiol-disulfide oxidoreductase YuxK